MDTRVHEENVEVQPTRRRRHGIAFKACLQPGGSIAAVALRYRLNANLFDRDMACDFPPANPSG